MRVIGYLSLAQILVQQILCIVLFNVMILVILVILMVQVIRILQERRALPPMSVIMTEDEHEKLKRKRYSATAQMSQWPLTVPTEG